MSLINASKIDVHYRLTIVLVNLEMLSRGSQMLSDFVASVSLRGIGWFICFQDSPYYITYRAELHGTLLASTSQLLRDLEEWTLSGTPISVQAQLLIPDVICAVAISSIGEEECSRPTDVVTMNTMTESSALPITGIVAGIIVGMVVFILIVALVLVILLIRYHRKSSSFNLKRDSRWVR